VTCQHNHGVCRPRAGFQSFVCSITRQLHPRRVIIPMLLVLLLSGCAPGEASLNMLDPQGPDAAEIATLWWLMFWMGLAVYVGVFIFALWAIFGVRRRDPDAPPFNGQRILIWGGIVFPVPILAIVAGYTLYVGNLTAGFPPVLERDRGEYLTVDVIGHQFWWEVRYLNEGVVTANEIHIPAGQRVRFRVNSADVIHSFWFPQLHGKVDMVPGNTSTIWMSADEPGVYRGICAEFCGAQHAHMQLLLIAQPMDEFQAWLEQQRTVPPNPEDPMLQQGRQVFMGSGCVYCHTVLGVNQDADTDPIGPDLTHLASRRTLGAVMMENNRGNLGGWILDPQSMKPGNKMPPTRIDAADFQALLAYLESLR
jgi:cytochrome c oxidase subunit II